jgi:hypothetical protein
MTLRTSFRFHLVRLQHLDRKAPISAAMTAIGFARQDVAQNVDRYLSCGDIGAATKGARFVENPRANGLRFVGYADKIVSLRHTGHYTDPDGSSSIRGVVYQLPSRQGRPLYVAGHDNADNGAADAGGPALLDFSRLFEGRKGGAGASSFDDCDSGAREAAWSADSFAEREAEEEREYQTAWQAGARFAQVLEDYRATRKTILAGLKHSRTAPHDVRAIWVANACELRSECFTEMAQLVRGNWSGLEFYPSDRLTVAFYEGRGI